MYRQLNNVSLLFLFSSFIFQFTAFNMVLAEPYFAKDMAVCMSTEVKNVPPSITIKWAKNPYAINYELRRINPDFYLGKFDSTQTSYTDTNVVAGQAYEYAIYSKCKRVIDDSTITNFVAVGYLYSGIEVAAVPTYGSVLLLVDSTISNPLSTEIKTLTDDLVLEGWNVVKRDVARTEQFDKDRVKEVKKVITEVKNEIKDLSALIIFGRIAVPYSGDFNPDLHDEHKGAWPADMYYSNFDESIWTDTIVNNTTSKRIENRNIPGDGKFDLSELPNGYDLQLAVGRIDFFNMATCFDTSYKEPELEYYRMYLNKNHDYRSGKTEYEMKALVDDNFVGMPETFASDGWRNFSTMIK